MNNLTKNGQYILTNAICALVAEIADGVTAIHHNAQPEEIKEAVAIAKSKGCNEVTLDCTPVRGGKNHVASTEGKWLGGFVSARELAA